MSYHSSQFALHLLIVSFLTLTPEKKLEAKILTKESPKKSTETILFLGDSLTEGYGISEKQAFPSLIGEQLRKDYPKRDFRVVNAGKAGASTSTSVARLKWYLRMRPKPRYLVLALGANDSMRGYKPEEVRNNLNATLELAKKANLKILCGMMAPRSMGAEYYKAFDKIYPELAAQHKILLLPFLLAGVATKKELNLADGIHPNPSGHKLIFQLVYPKLKELL